MRIKTILLTSVIILTSCSGDILEPKIKEINTGTYQLKGVQIEKQLCYICSVGEEGHVMSTDTTEIEFTVEVEYPKGKRDTVRFRGLEGADAGEYTATSRSYCTPPYCYADAKLRGSELTFNLESVSGYYNGRGFLGAGELALKTQYKYRGIGVDYILEGEKID